MYRVLLSSLVLLFQADLLLAQQPPALVSVDEVVEQRFTQTAPILGRLVAKQSGTVATRTSGAISDVFVQPGDKVRKGELLATIDASALLLQKQLADSQIVEAQSRLKTANAQLALAGQEVKRLEGLKSSASVSKAAYDDARQQQNIAFSRVSEAEAAINTSRANLRLAELELSYTSIVAPYDGTVTRKLTEVGSYLQRGQPVIELLSDGDLELEADVPAAQLGGLKPGVQITLLLDNGSKHSATVRAIIPEENPRTRTRRVRFDTNLSDNAGILASDQSATVLVPISEDRNVVTVHKDAVIRRGPQSVVYVVKEDAAQIATIKTGQSIDNRIEVLEGLAIGDIAVIRGNERLRPNQPVQIQP